MQKYQSVKCIIGHLELTIVGQGIHFKALALLMLVLSACLAQCFGGTM